jgi:outer membrane protein assembly factor BamB
LIKIDARSGVVLWKNDQLRFRYLGRPILNDGVVYAVDKQGYLHGFDATTGELVARLNLADALHYPLASEGSALLAVTRQGAFYKIGIKTKQ